MTASTGTHARTVALVIHGLRHFHDADGQVGHHRAADPACPCKPEPVVQGS